MASRIEDYALISDCQTAALVARDGSIDWLCVPRFDSAACFAALLGNEENGRWQIAPKSPVKKVERRYRGDTLVLETRFETDEGVVTLVDCMPPRGREPDLVRLVIGEQGSVPMRMRLAIRCDYGSIVPWVRRTPWGLRAVAGPDTLLLHTPVEMHGEDLVTVADFVVAAGDRIPFVLSWHESHATKWHPKDAEETIEQTETWWTQWASHCTYQGPWREAVVRSLITLKGLTYMPTGGIVAAATTSLPEQIGGVRNWDYRYCWVRDATFTLYSLMGCGYTEEALAWRHWLLRAVAGTPSQINIMYGLAGERRLTELELGWLSGYENSSPVRIGNAAYRQFQLDVFGELMDALHQARRLTGKEDDDAWRVQRLLATYLETAWQKPDEGIWEVRGPQRHFTHSKVMAWVAMDRLVKAVERFNLDGPVDQWRATRDAIHREVCQRAFDPQQNAFVQHYESQDLDASLLMIPLVGFLPPTDPRVIGTVAAIQRHLTSDGLVARYPTQPHVDGLPPGEGAFLACSFWLADNLVLLKRRDEAEQLFERLLSLRNDVGLLSEEYDPQLGRQVGNFPQAFSHVGLINTARNLVEASCPAEDRRK